MIGIYMPAHRTRATHGQHTSNIVKNRRGSNHLMKTMLQIGEDQIQFILLKYYKYSGEF
jgi:hypothetical protein